MHRDEALRHCVLESITRASHFFEDPELAAAIDSTTKALNAEISRQNIEIARATLHALAHDVKDRRTRDAAHIACYALALADHVLRERGQRGSHAGLMQSLETLTLVKDRDCLVAHCLTQRVISNLWTAIEEAGGSGLAHT